ncbi:MCP four helix bundle domain-containing protein [Bradyrhizobium manausense]|uniref:MCP four helix bundle domain-containing protein n=1 Tax=Bradyrhizobium manausense TaxID=989370 RepID=UPI001BA8A9EF|nr:MCP four helix bundle domain-containing protein [Bradyrhizobium manausense]MBR0725544.1 MCP four helix bundle domain-containing protein [Bradyrhizobium manausense]
MRISLKTILLSISELLASLVIFQAALSILQLNAMGTKVRDLGGNWIPSVRALGDVKYDIAIVRLRSTRYISSAQTAGREQLRAALANTEDKAKTALSVYEPLISSGSERASWNDLKDAWKSYLRLQNQAISMADSNDIAGATELLNEGSFSAFE